MATQPYTLANGSTADGGQTNSNFVEIYSNITNDNISASAAISFSKLASDAWTTNTPSWTAATTNPTIGNGSIAGRYVKIGRICKFDWMIIIGSTTTFGSGIYSISLPFTAATVSSFDRIGSFSMYETATTTYRVGLCQLGSAATTLSMYIHLLSSGGVSQGYPYTIGTGDVIRGTITYETAS